MSHVRSHERPASLLSPEVMDSEDALFCGTRGGWIDGQTQGLVHTTGGYSLFAAYDAKTFIVRGDIFACVAGGRMDYRTYRRLRSLLLGNFAFGSCIIPILVATGI
jgi:hypothetical protein